MVYIGIVGALTSLGQEVAHFLREKTELYRIVFYVDADYVVNSPQKATYATPEAALSFNQPPTLIIDCADPISAVDRAKTYRFYAVPAIMCCTCMPKELDDLSCSYVAENQRAPALIITPDYCLNIVRLFDFFLHIADRHREDITRVEVEVALPPRQRINLARWLYFGSLMNDKFGNSDARYSVKGNVCKYGYVEIKTVSNELLAENAEDVHIRLFYGNKQNLCCTFMKTTIDNRDAASVSGISLMLKWFVSHPRDVASGQVFINHLSTILHK